MISTPAPSAPSSLSSGRPQRSSDTASSAASPTSGHSVCSSVHPWAFQLFCLCLTCCFCSHTTSFLCLLLNHSILGFWAFTEKVHQNHPCFPDNSGVLCYSELNWKLNKTAVIWCYFPLALRVTGYILCQTQKKQKSWKSCGSHNYRSSVKTHIFLTFEEKEQECKKHLVFFNVIHLADLFTCVYMPKTPQLFSWCNAN